MRFARWVVLALLLVAGVFWATQRETPVRAPSETNDAPTASTSRDEVSAKKAAPPRAAAPAQGAHPTFRVETMPPPPAGTAANASTISQPMLLELARALEDDILADGAFHSGPALRAVSDENFDDTLAALAAQAANDPGALAAAHEMAERLERSQLDPEVSKLPGRVVCGTNLCVTEQRTTGNLRAASPFRVGAGQGNPQPDGSMLHRMVYVARRGIGHAAPAPRH